MNFKEFVEDNTPFAVFVLAKCANGNYAATTRASDRGESGKIGLPGGKVDPGENPINAAMRESKEEGWLITVPPDSEPIYRQIFEGKLVWWYMGYNPQMLSDYKEKHRITPFEATGDEILKSGYSNENLRKYL